MGVQSSGGTSEDMESEAIVIDSPEETVSAIEGLSDEARENLFLAVQEVQDSAENREGDAESAVDAASTDANEHLDTYINNLSERLGEIEDEEFQRRVDEAVESRRSAISKAGERAKEKMKELLDSAGGRLSKVELSDDTRNDLYNAWVRESGGFESVKRMGGMEEFKYRGRKVDLSRKPEFKKYLQGRLESDFARGRGGPEKPEEEKKSQVKEYLDKARSEKAGTELREQYENKIEALEKENKDLRRRVKTLEGDGDGGQQEEGESEVRAPESVEAQDEVQEVPSETGEIEELVSETREEATEEKPASLEGELETFLLKHISPVDLHLFGRGLKKDVLDSYYSTTLEQIPGLEREEFNRVVESMIKTKSGEGFVEETVVESVKDESKEVLADVDLDNLEKVPEALDVEVERYYNRVKFGDESDEEGQRYKDEMYGKALEFASGVTGKIKEGLETEPDSMLNKIRYRALLNVTLRIQEMNIELERKVSEGLGRQGIDDEIHKAFVNFRGEYAKELSRLQKEYGEG